MSINPEIRALEARIKVLREQEEAALRQYKNDYREAWGVFLQTMPYDYSVQPRLFSEFMSSKTYDGAYVCRRVNPDKLALFLSVWPNMEADGEALIWRGMTYYRTDEGILTHGGGGYHILHTPMLCNDAEWDAILKMEIPAKYMKAVRA